LTAISPVGLRGATLSPGVRTGGLT
jgi:hypothetical protein